MAESGDPDGLDTRAMADASSDRTVAGKRTAGVVGVSPEGKAPSQARARTGPRKVEPGSGVGLGPTPHAFAERYSVQHSIGAGSMGEVVVVRDQMVLREVALKRLHSEHHEGRPDLRERFLREARVQGQLEHPSVVPVYDIGIDSEGHEYFTMKRVRGRTLVDVLRGLREGEPDLVKQYSRRRLLTAMSRLCLTVAFAHERGVVHRDIKPSNIMLGDYGEVHLLDWGIAKILGVEEPARFSSGLDLGGEPLPRTESGFVVGTPGYMAPEQARGETRTYGGRSDIYALGAILFEMMTLRRLHDAGSVEEILLSTVQGVEARPSVRAAHLGLPLELDTLLMRATQLNPEQRFASARELNDAIERLLDGDRDNARRAEMADAHTARARAALSWARRGGAEANGQHRRAVGELLQALALDPENAEARSTMVRLLLEPTDRLPAEAYAELQEADRLDRTRAHRANTWAFLSWMGTLPLMVAMGVRDLPALMWLGGASIVLLAYTWWMAATHRTQAPYMLLSLLLTFGTIAGMSLFFGPLFLVSGVAVTAASSYLVATRSGRRSQLIVLAASLLAVLVPAALQLCGIGEPRYLFDDKGMTILPGVVRLPERATWAFLLISNGLTIVLANLLVGRAVSSLLRAERRLFAQAWRLRQFLPELSTRAQRAKGADERRPTAPA